MTKIDVKSAKRLMQEMEKLEFHTKAQIEEGSTATIRELYREILSRPQGDEAFKFTLKLVGVPREACLCELIMKLTSYGLMPTWIKVDDYSKSFIHTFVICNSNIDKFVNIKIKLSGQDVMTTTPTRSFNCFAAKKYEHSMIRWSPDGESPKRTILLTRTKNSELKQKAIPSISDYYCAILKGYSNESIEEFVTRYFNESEVPVMRPQRSSGSREESHHSRYRSRSPLNHPERSFHRSISPPERPVRPQRPRTPTIDDFMEYQSHQSNRDKILESISKIERQNRENEKHLQGVKRTIENFQRQAFNLENIIQESNQEIIKLKSQINYL